MCVCVCVCVCVREREREQYGVIIKSHGVYGYSSVPQMVPYLQWLWEIMHDRLAVINTRMPAQALVHKTLNFTAELLELYKWKKSFP